MGTIRIADEVSAPATPADGVRLYSLDSELYYLDEAGVIHRLSDIPGGALATDEQLIAWTEAGAYEMLAITYHGTYTGVVASATVEWPDGSAGTFTATTINTTWQAIDAYTVTHTASSKTVAQTAVTRNADGNITVKPELTVAVA